MGTTSPAENLREAVKNRRGRLGLKAAQAAAAGGMPIGTWSAIEQGKSMNPKPTTLAELDVALQWPPMTAYQVHRGRLTPAEAVNLPIEPPAANAC